MAKPGSSDKHIEAAQRRLVHLSGLAGQAAETEKRIKDAAEDRLAKVSGELDQLRPRVNLDPNAAELYQTGVLEVGQLRRVIAQAEQALA